jgi:outer membrane protein OmpA-like peptidoglycan-associated protein
MKTPALVLAFSMLCATLPAQNLVPNPGFEDHGRIECLSCHSEASSFKKLNRNWDDLNTNPVLHDCRYIPSHDEVRKRWGYLKAIPFFEGCSMMEMVYSSNCMDFRHETKGCPSYVGTELIAPLEVGKVYEVSFWLYIAERENMDPAYPAHIGFGLYQAPLRHPHGGMIPHSGFLLDTVIFHTWYQAKWQVRALCPLSYLVVGVFRGDSWPGVHTYENNSYYFIDQLSVRECSREEAVQAVPTPFCRYQGEAPAGLVPSIRGTDCFFGTGSSELSPECRSGLDAFILRARAEPQATFIISGHTDSIGSGHEALAAARLSSVLDYLEREGRLSRLRFLPLAAGAAQPIADNATEVGRGLNRRVEIRPADYPLGNLIYRAALEYAFAGDTVSAAKTLDKWLNVAADGRKLLLLYDPRFTLLNGKPQWHRLEEKVRKSYGSKRLQFALDSLWAEDQKHRTLKYYIENLATYLHQSDKGDPRWDVDFPSPSPEEQLQRDQAHYQALQRLIAAHGWPRASEVGERPAKAAFLIVQHQPDTAALAQALPLLRARCLEGEAEWIYYAAMYDRLQAMRGLPQRYGTQFRPTPDGGQELYPLEDPAKVNAWREELGLVPLEEPKWTE